jgi:hypothetical protein
MSLIEARVYALNAVIKGNLMMVHKEREVRYLAAIPSPDANALHWQLRLRTAPICG